MTDTTQRFGTPYPSENQQSWYDTFESMVQSVDSLLFAGWEDQNYIVYGGGVLNWDGAGALSWSEDIVFVSPTLGRAMTLPAGSVAITEGQFLFLSMTRGATAAVTLSLTAASNVPPTSQSKVFACWPVGTTNVVFFTGVSVSAGIAALGITGTAVSPYQFALAKTVIEAGDEFTIPAGYQYIVSDGLTIDGTLNIDGELVVLGEDSVFTATTVDNTPTEIAEYSLPDDGVALVKASITAFSASGNAAHFIAGMISSAGGTHVVASTGNVYSGGSLSVSIVATVSGIAVEVTGHAADTTDWTVKWEIV